MPVNLNIAGVVFKNVKKISPVRPSEVVSLYVVRGWAAAPFDNIHLPMHSGIGPLESSQTHASMPVASTLLPSLSVMRTCSMNFTVAVAYTARNRSREQV